MNFDITESHKKAVFHPLSKRYIFGETIGQIDPSALLGIMPLVYKGKKYIYIIT